MKYIVDRPELHYQSVEIKASSPEEAIQKVNDGEGRELNLEYSHTLELDNWKVFEKKGESNG